MSCVISRCPKCGHIEKGMVLHCPWCKTVMTRIYDQEVTSTNEDCNSEGGPLVDV